MLRSTPQDRLISRHVGVGYTQDYPPAAGPRGPVSCVSRAGKCFGWHGVERGVTQHKGASSIEW